MNPGAPAWAKEADRRTARIRYMRALWDAVPEKELERLCKMLRLAKYKIQQYEPALLLWHYAGKYKWQEYRKEAQ